MYHEIERKFLVKKLPDLTGLIKVPQERYFIQRSLLFEEGLKKKGSHFLYETKFTLSQQEKIQEKINITKEEFEALKYKGTDILKRDSYQLSKKKPIVCIKKYKGDYKGLILSEVLFDSVDEMEAFEKFSWMGKEVTDTVLGKDARLIDLSREDFLRVLEEVRMSDASRTESFL